MNELRIHADRTQPALVHADALPWIASPESGVERKMLERLGGEIALATSIVRYQPGSQFTSHRHDLGEEFHVLEGTFSDEHGDYAEGSYVRNPPGSSHTPFSIDGCTIFVKLRQMCASDTLTVRALARDHQWRAGDAPGHERVTLHETGEVQVTLERLATGCAIAPRTARGGEEIFVLSGSIRLDDDSHSSMTRWSWRRDATTAQPALRARSDALLWVKRGHLPAQPV